MPRTARYATLGDHGGALRQVGFACHGYSQLVAQFIRYFGAIDDGTRLIVAPEALSRFYIESRDGGHGLANVGATWMTREDRESEISDYVVYLDSVYNRIFDDVDRSSVSVWVLGFSQGAATVSRWITRGEAAIDHLILWGGFLPTDLDMPAFKARVSSMRLTLVTGDKDPLVLDRDIADAERVLASHGIVYELERFDGGHQLSKDVLARVVGPSA